MDQFKSLFSSSSSKPSHHSDGADGHEENPSSGDLMASAQLIFSAAKSKLPHGEGKESEGEDVDMGRVAGAAADVLGAAKHYAKLEESSYGQYIQKAEDYLESYEQKHKTGGAPAHHRPPSSSDYSEETEYEEQKHGKHSSDGNQVNYGKHSSDEEGVNYGKHSSEESRHGDGDKYGKYFEKAQQYFGK